MTTKKKRRPRAAQTHPSRCVLGPTRFRLGERVRYDFAKVYGIPRAKSRVVGTIVKSCGRFLTTPEFARWEHVVLLDEVFCSERLWTFEEEKLEPA